MTPHVNAAHRCARAAAAAAERFTCAVFISISCLHSLQNVRGSSTSLDVVLVLMLEHQADNDDRRYCMNWTTTDSASTT